MFKFFFGLILVVLSVCTPVQAGTWSRAEPAITRAAYLTGYPAGELAGVASLESGFKAKAVSRQRAKGMFQITPSTYRYLAKKYAKKHGIHNPNPNNPLHSAILGAEYLKEIKAHMSRKLKRPALYEEAYLGYFIGPDRAVTVIKTPGWKDAVAMMPSVASGHKKFFYTKYKRHHSVREFRRAVYNEYRSHVGEYRSVARIAMNKHVKKVRAKKQAIAKIDWQQRCFNSEPPELVVFSTSMILDKCQSAYESRMDGAMDRRRRI